MKRDHHIPLFHPRLVRRRAQAVSPERLEGLAAVIAPFIDHLRRGVLDAGADSGAALDEMRRASDRSEREVTAKLYREDRELRAASYAELRQRHSNIRYTKRRPPHAAVPEAGRSGRPRSTGAANVPLSAGRPGAPAQAGRRGESGIS